MELRHLRYFVAVAEELNFSHAAARLHVSQPPLSRQIKDLENELGVQLFERRKNRVRLTEAGDFFYREAAHLLQQTERVVREVQQIAESHRERFHVGYIANVQGRLVIEAATRFRKAHPGVTVKVFDESTANQVQALLAGRLDLGFIGFADAAAKRGLHIEQIGTTYAVMALPREHPLSRERNLPLAAFRHEPFITISEDTFPGTRQYVLKFCAQAGFQPRIVHEALQPLDVLNLVAIGGGVALVPEQMRQQPATGVVYRELREPVPRAESYVAWRNDRTSELLLEWVECAKAAHARLTSKPRRRRGE